jgi:hypothetical protein
MGHFHMLHRPDRRHRLCVIRSQRRYGEFWRWRQLRRLSFLELIEAEQISLEADAALHLPSCPGNASRPRTGALGQRLLAERNPVILR